MHAFVESRAPYECDACGAPKAEHEKGATRESRFRVAARWLIASQEALSRAPHPPHITDGEDDDGQLTFEWWKGKKELAVYFDEVDARSSFLRVWGTNIFDEMAGGDPFDVSSLAAAMDWLNAAEE